MSVIYDPLTGQLATIVPARPPAGSVDQQVLFNDGGLVDMHYQTNDGTGTLERNAVGNWSKA